MDILKMQLCRLTSTARWGIIASVFLRWITTTMVGRIFTWLATALPVFFITTTAMGLLLTWGSYPEWLTTRTGASRRGWDPQWPITTATGISIFSAQTFPTIPPRSITTTAKDLLRMLRMPLGLAPIR